MASRDSTIASAPTQTLKTRLIEIDGTPVTGVAVTYTDSTDAAEIDTVTTDAYGYAGSVVAPVGHTIAISFTNNFISSTGALLNVSGNGGNGPAGTGAGTGATSVGAGGNATANTGGGGGGAKSGSGTPTGGSGATGSDIDNGVTKYGSGGGGGGGGYISVSAGGNGGSAGNYGGGGGGGGQDSGVGGNGAQGLIYLTYTPAAASSSIFFSKMPGIG